jgi:propanediol dehydratase small subunit
MTLMLLAVLALVVFLAATGRLGLSMADLLEPEYEEDRDWISTPEDRTIDFHEALRPYGSARRGE